MAEPRTATIEEHDKLLNENVLPRLGEIEKGQQKFAAEMHDMRMELAHVKNGQTSLENTVMKDGQHTRDLLTKVIDFLTDSKIKEAETKKEIAIHEATNNKDIKIKKLDAKQAIIVGVVSAVFGGGTVLGLVALFFQ